MAETMLQITDLVSSYGSIQALKGISLEIQKGEIVSLLGANGAGKSTLMKSILGMVHIDGGSIQFQGQELVGKKSHEIVPMGISLVPEGRKIFIELSVEKNLEIGTFFRKRSPERDKELLDMVYQVFPACMSVAPSWAAPSLAASSRCWPWGVPLCPTPNC